MPGLSEFTDKPIFDASLFVTIRKRLGVAYIDVRSESSVSFNRTNRRILKLLKIKIGGKPLGRPPKEQQTAGYQEQMAKNVGQRNEMEATFGTGKRVYRANDIRAKLPDTGAAWTAACYFTKNVMKFLKELLYALIRMMLIVVFGDGIHEKLENERLRIGRNVIFTTLCRI